VTVAKVMLKVPKFLTFGLSCNNNAESGKQDAIRLIKNAKKSIMVLSGELNEGFYCNSAVQEAIEVALHKNVRIQLAFGPVISDKCFAQLKGMVSDHPNLTLYQLPKRPVRHYMVIDQAVRLQRVHPPGTQEHRAIIKENSPFVVAAFEDAFTDLIKKAKIV
jgi:hypothetical protein